MKKYLQLTRPRIVLMVLFALAVAAWCSGASPPTWSQLLHAIVGTALITAGSVALNQWYEQRSDALMARTQHRPIPTGRIPSGQALAFGVGTSLLGLCYLAVFSDRLVAIVAVLDWVFYVACYTPLKSVSVWQLPVGAVAGAMPMVIGGAVAGTPCGAMTWMLFGIVFFWQFPHAIAIAWIYRDHYANANLQVATVADPSGQIGRHPGDARGLDFAAGQSAADPAPLQQLDIWRFRGSLWSDLPCAFRKLPAAAARWLGKKDALGILSLLTRRPGRSATDDSPRLRNPSVADSNE